jgi:hypothetical protein
MTQRPLNTAAADIRLAYSLSQSAEGFVRNLAERGFKLARVWEDEANRSHRIAEFATELGRFAPEYQRGDYVAINQRGHVYGLNRTTTGEDRADVEKFMATLNPMDFKGIDAVQRKAAAERETDSQQRREKDRVFAATGPLNKHVADIRLAYSLSQSPDGFVKNLDEIGYKLACVTKDEAERSHRNAAFAKEGGRFAPEYQEGEYVVINERGHAYRLNRRMTGESREDTEAFLRTIDSTKLLGLEATRQHIGAYKRTVPAREIFPGVSEIEGHPIRMASHAQPLNTWQQFGRAAYEETERDRAPDHVRGTSAEIWTAFKRSDNARAFVAALQERNITVAIVTRQDVINSQIDRYYATDVRPAPTPELREGSFVAVTENGQVYNLNQRTTGASAERVQKFMALLDRKEFQGVYDVLGAIQERAALHDIERQAFRDLKAGSFKRPKDFHPTGREGREFGNDAIDLDNVKGPAAISKGAARSLGKVFDVAANAFESLLAPKLTPKQKWEGQVAKLRREAEADHSVDFSRYTAEMAQQRRIEQEREAERQRQNHPERDRDGGGRER